MFVPSIYTLFIKMKKQITIPLLLPVTLLLVVTRLLGANVGIAVTLSPMAVDIILRLVGIDLNLTLYTQKDDD